MTAIPLETLVTVFGGSGFLGRHVVRALAKRGYRIRVAVRRPELAGHLQPLGRVGQIHAVQANLRYPASVEAAARGADVLINLVGILFERGRQQFDAVQAFGAEAVALAAAAYRRAPDPCLRDRRRRERSSRYARSKAAGRKARARRRAARPSSCGPRSCSARRTISSTGSRPSRASRRRCRWSAAAIPGSSRCSPATSPARSSPRSKAAPRTGTTYELGGPEVRTFKELMQFVLATIERRRLLVPLPFALAKLQAAFLQFMPKPLLTPDQVELLRSDNVVSEQAEREGRTLEALGIAPVAMEAIVPSYLWRFRKTGQFADHIA